MDSKCVIVLALSAVLVEETHHCHRFESTKGLIQWACNFLFAFRQTIKKIEEGLSKYPQEFSDLEKYCR